MVFVESKMSYETSTRSRFCAAPVVPSFSLQWNPTRALNPTSLKCCLASTDPIPRREKIHACIWRFKITSGKCASLKSTRFLQKKKRVGYCSTIPSLWWESSKGLKQFLFHAQLPNTSASVDILPVMTLHYNIYQLFITSLCKTFTELSYFSRRFSVQFLPFSILVVPRGMALILVILSSNGVELAWCVRK